MSARPLVNLSLAVNYHFGQLDPAGYRVFNIVVHLMSALLLWGIVGRTLRLAYFQGRFDGSAGPLGFCVALIWSLHPLATEAVAYVTQRTESIMAFFYLSALYASLRYWAATGTRVRALWLMMAAAACLLGAFSKEMIASAPAVVLLMERTFISGSFKSALRRSWPLYVGLTLGWGVLAAINLNGPRTPLAGFGLGVSAPDWWLTQVKVLFLYSKLAIWPWPLVIHYDLPYLRTIAEAWPWLLAGALVGLAIVWLTCRRAAAGFALITAVAILSPTLIVPLVGEIAVERRMYLPLAALAALVVIGGYAVLQRLAGRLAPALGIASVCALSVVLALVSARRLAAYQEEITLWQDAATHQPHDPLVHINLGILLNKAGMREEGTRHLRQAVELDPDSYHGHYNLALAYEEAGQPGEAVEQYELTLRSKSDHAAAHNNLGRLLSVYGSYAEAIDHFEQALRCDPGLSAAHNNLGIARLNAGNVPQAIEHFKEALRLQATIEGHTNLAGAYAAAGRRAEAVATAEKGAALARDQDRHDLAKRIEGAIETFRREGAPRP